MSSFSERLLPIGSNEEEDGHTRVPPLSLPRSRADSGGDDVGPLPSGRRDHNRTVSIIGYLPDLMPLVRGNSFYKERRIGTYGSFVDEGGSEQLPTPPVSPATTPVLKALFASRRAREGPEEPTVRCSDFLREGSIRGSVFNLCSASLGAGALSLPYAAKQSGLLLCLALLLLGALATIFSIRLLVESRRLTGLRSYEDMTVKLLGRRFGILVELNIIIFCFGTAVAYVVAMSDILRPVLRSLGAPKTWLGFASENWCLLVFWMFVMLPLSLVKQINSLRFTSFLGVLAIFYLVLATIADTIITSNEHGWGATWGGLKLFNPSFVDVVQACPIIMFAFTCQVNVFSIYNELERPSRRRMGKVTNRAVGVCFTVYALMCISGYSDFGDSTRANVLDNFCLQEDPRAYVVLAFAAIALTVTMAFPMSIFPCRYTLEVMLFGNEVADTEVGARSTVLSVVISGGALILGMFVDKINVVFQLMGGTTSAFVCFVLPAIFALKLNWAGLGSRVLLRNFMVWSLLLGGAGIGTVSTAVTILGIMSPSEAPEPICVKGA